MKKICLLLLALCALSTQAQISPLATPATIEVLGTAEIKVLPDEIFIQFTLKEKTVNREKISIRQQEEKLLAALNGIGVGPHQISFTDQSTSYERVSWRKREAITEKEFVLKVRDSKTVGQVFEELEKLEIFGAFIARTQHSKIDSLTKAVHILAIKKAKEKADYLLGAVSETTGKVYYVSENQEEYGKGLSVRGNRSLTKDEIAEAFRQFEKHQRSYEDVQILIDKIVLTANLLVKFLIK